MAPLRRGSSQGRNVSISRSHLIAIASAVVLCAGVASSARAASLCAGIQTNCRAAARTSLRLKNSSADEQDRLAWRWLRGAATTVADFGLPTGTTQYALCIYAGTATAAIAEADIAPSSTLWAARGTTGFRYKDRALTSDGIRKVRLAAGNAGQPKVVVTGKGVNLPDPPAGPLALPVTVQMVNSSNSVCFEGIYTDADVKPNANTEVLFKAKFPPR